MKQSLEKTTELFLECFRGCAEDENGDLQLHLDKRFKRAFKTRTQQAEEFAQEMLRLSLDNMKAKLETENGSQTDSNEVSVPYKAKGRTKKRTP